MFQKFFKNIFCFWTQFCFCNDASSFAQALSASVQITHYRIREEGGSKLIKSLNQNIFEKFKLNRNLQMIPFKMMYDMSMLRYRFSNEQTFCKLDLFVWSCVFVTVTMFIISLRPKSNLDSLRFVCECGPFW